MEPTTSLTALTAAQISACDSSPSPQGNFFTWLGRQITLLSDEITKLSFNAFHFLTTFATAPSSPINTKAQPWSPSTLAPTVNSSQIFSCLDSTTLRSFTRVSKTWQKETAKAASLQETALYQELRDKGVIFGPEDWRTYFGDPGEVPPLDPKTFKILKGPCPFWPEKKVEETHILLFLPATNNGAPITFNSLGKLARAPQGGGTATGYRGCYDDDDYRPGFLNDVIRDYGDAPIGPARWVLITKQIVPGSRGNMFILDNFHLYQRTPKIPEFVTLYQRTPKIAEAVALAFTRCVSTGEHLLHGPYDYTYCEEMIDDRFLVTVGCFEERGLNVAGEEEGLCYGYEDHLPGVIGVLPCGSSQPPDILDNSKTWSLSGWIRKIIASVVRDR